MAFNLTSSGKGGAGLPEIAMNNGSNGGMNFLAEQILKQNFSEQSLRTMPEFKALVKDIISLGASPEDFIKNNEDKNTAAIDKIGTFMGRASGYFKKKGVNKLTNDIFVDKEGKPLNAMNLERALLVNGKNYSSEQLNSYINVREKAGFGGAGDVVLARKMAENADDLEEYIKKRNRIYEEVDNGILKAANTADQLRKLGKAIDEFNKAADEEALRNMQQYLSGIKDISDQLEMQKRQIMGVSTWNSELGQYISYGTQAAMGEFKKSSEYQNLKDPQARKEALQRFVDINEGNAMFAQSNNLYAKEKELDKERISIKAETNKDWKKLRAMRRRELIESFGLGNIDWKDRSKLTTEQIDALKRVDAYMAGDQTNRVVKAKSQMRNSLQESILQGTYLGHPLGLRQQRAINEYEAITGKKFTSRNDPMRKNIIAKEYWQSELERMQRLYESLPRQDIIYTNSLAQRGGFRTGVKVDQRENDDMKLKQSLLQQMKECVNTLKQIDENLK